MWCLYGMMLVEIVGIVVVPIQHVVVVEVVAVVVGCQVDAVGCDCWEVGDWLTVGAVVEVQVAWMVVLNLVAACVGAVGETSVGGVVGAVGAGVTADGIADDAAHETFGAPEMVIVGAVMVEVVVVVSLVVEDTAGQVVVVVVAIEHLEVQDQVEWETQLVAVKQVFVGKAVLLQTWGADHGSKVGDLVVVEQVEREKEVQ